MKLLHVALNEFRLLLRDRPALLLMIAVPIAVITVTGFALGGIYGKSESFVKIYLPVVDLDKGAAARSLVDALKGETAFDVERVEVEKASKLVRDDNRAAAALIVPEGFSRAALAKKPSFLRLLTDPAKGLEVMTTKALLAATLAKLANEASGGQPGAGAVEIRGENLTGIKGNITSFDENVPGFSIMFIMFGVLSGFSEGIFRERDEEHTLQRLLLAPLSKFGLLGGKVLAWTVVAFVQLSTLLGFGYFAFHISLGNSLLALALTILGVAFAASSIGLLLSSLSRSREQARSLGTLTILTMAATGGCWWPLFIEPKWMQRLSHVSMPAWAMDCFFDLMIRGKELADILPALGGLYLYGAVALSIGVLLSHQVLFRRA